MKVFLISITLVIAVLAAGVFFLVNNLDSIVETAIERVGSQTAGSAVEVGSVRIDLSEGTASVYDFSIANPEGFSNEAMISFAELSIVLDLQSITGDVIGIRSIVAREPYVLYEGQGNTSNLQVMSDRLPQGEPAPDSTTSSVEMLIDEVLIEDIQALLRDERLPRSVTVNLGNIELSALEGTPQEIARQIIRPVIEQLTRRAAEAFVDAAAGELRENLEGEVEQRSEELEESINRQIDEAVGEDVREGFGDFLRGN